MFNAVYSRHGELCVRRHDSYDEAVDDLQGSAEFGEAFGHGVYDVERGVAFYPRIGDMGSDFAPHHQRALMKALGLESPPPVAGLYRSLRPPEYEPDAIQVQCLKTWYAAGDGSVTWYEQVSHAVLGLLGEGARRRIC